MRFFKIQNNKKKCSKFRRNYANGLKITTNFTKFALKCRQVMQNHERCIKPQVYGGCRFENSVEFFFPAALISGDGDLDLPDIMIPLSFSMLVSLALHPATLFSPLNILFTLFSRAASSSDHELCHKTLQFLSSCQMAD